MGLFVRDSLTCHNQPFPPVSVHNSASFQFDLANNNIHSYPSQSYLFEAYHTEIVIIHFTTRIFACIPKPQYNMFGYPTQTEIYEAETFSNMVYSIKDQVHAKIQLVLNNFDEFIQDQSPNWSPLQLYAIESVYQLYSIHLKFIKTKLTFSTRLFESPIRYLDQDNTWLTFNVDNTESTPEDTILSELDLADPAVVAQLTSVFPLVLTLIEKMELFLQSPKNYHENTATLPFGLMASILETAARLFILKYQLEPENREVMQKQIQSVYALSKHDIWKQHFTTAKVIQKRLKNYLKSMPSNRRTENPPVDILMNDWGALVYWDQDPPISLQEFDDLFEQSFFQSLT